jgi:hypothetical protein
MNTSSSKYPLILVALFVLANTAHAESDPYIDYTEESRKIAQEFMQKLAATLKQQLESSGTESAIKVCKEVAPALAAEYSANNRLVKRVSLKPRNQFLGTPTDVERNVLKNFDEKQRTGATGMMESSMAYEDADGSWFHYMRAIPTQPQCLQCHGSLEQIAPNVRALLSAEYPADRATGYSAGDIRGAISIKHKIQ